MYGLDEKEIYLYRAVQNGDSATGKMHTDFIKTELLDLFKQVSYLRVVNSEQENRIKEMQKTIKRLEEKCSQLNSQLIELVSFPES